MQVLHRLIPKLDYRGVNMVDLMMWLVIAALLLAAAIQSIGFYQKSAHLYQMKTEADVVASRVMASLSDRGTIDGAVIDAVVAEENAARNKDGIEVSWGAINSTAAPAPQEDYGFSLASVVTATSSSSQAYYLKVTNDAVKDSDVVYFLEDTASHNAGVSVLAKGALGPDAGPPAGAAVAGKCYTGQWKTSYYASYGFQSPLVVEECENMANSFNRQFGDGQPHPQLPSDNFSVRWEKEFTSQGGNYTFTARGDDHVAVFLDNTRIMTVQYVESTKSVTVNVPAGTHKLKVEMSDGVRNAYTTFSYAPSP